MAFGCDRYLKFGANTISGGNQDGVVISGSGKVEHSAKSPQFSIGARPGGGPHQGLDGLHKGVSSGDIYPRILISLAAYGVLARDKV
jgi:hypothetical protein